jgi:hypothetical protein
MVTAQQVPSAVITFAEPLTNSVEPLQSTVCSTPIPVMWVSPFFACAVGAAAPAATANAVPQAIADRLAVFTLGFSRRRRVPVA